MDVTNDVKYDEDVGASMSYSLELGTNSKAVSDINPGITINDACVFEVSKGYLQNNKWSLVIEADKHYKIDLK